MAANQKMNREWELQQKANVHMLNHFALVSKNQILLCNNVSLFPLCIPLLGCFSALIKGFIEYLWVCNLQDVLLPSSFHLTTPCTSCFQKNRLFGQKTKILNQLLITALLTSDEPNFLHKHEPLNHLLVKCLSPFLYDLR